MVNLNLFINLNNLVEVWISNNALNKNTFMSLRSNLHFVEISKIPKDNKDVFFRLRPLINHIKSVCNSFLIEENVSVDEQMIPFRGRSSVKQYFKNKPTSWGFKNFMLCGKSGQVYDYILYQESNIELSKYNVEKFGFGPSVVFHFSKLLKENWHKLYFDNYFSSYRLFEILKKNNINAAGTVRINRFFKPQFSEDRSFSKKHRGYFEEKVANDESVVIMK
jgi:hypothetical protein